MLELSARAQTISPSPTLSIDTKTKALKASGVDVVNLSVGEPDFPTPDRAALAGVAAIANQFTKYTDVSGILELRQAIANKLHDENGLSYTPAEIIVSSGAKHSLYNIFMVILNPGDEVLLPAPYWVSYPEQIRLAGGVVVALPTNEQTHFKITPAQLEAAITEKTKAILLNSPSNPTGSVYSPEEIQALASVIEKHSLFVISDEIYEQLIYGVTHYSIAQYSDTLKERTFLVNGFSKTYAMTGWRVGYVAGPATFIKAMSSFRSHTTANPASISQKAALGALGTFDPRHREEFKARRDYVLNELTNFPGVSCTKPDGAFYLFPNIKPLLGKTFHRNNGDAVILQSVDQLCEELLTELHVSTVPGSGFGAPENFRISYATSMEQLQKAMARMKDFFARID